MTGHDLEQRLLTGTEEAFRSFVTARILLGGMPPGPAHRLALDDALRVLAEGLELARQEGHFLARTGFVAGELGSPSWGPASASASGV